MTGPKKSLSNGKNSKNGKSRTSGTSKKSAVTKSTAKSPAMAARKTTTRKSAKKPAMALTKNSTKKRSNGRADKTKSINLGLQGGGTHGAFTWGVLDKILEDGRIEIDGISGTSAGAMNAVVLADALSEETQADLRDSARERLYKFWRATSTEAMGSPIHRSALDVFFNNWSLDHNPAFVFYDLLTRLASPYELNPLNIDPLRGVLEAQVDFDRVHKCDALKIFVSATNVHTGRARVFSGREVNADAVMASACLPFIFQAVEIDGTPYWDGGYMGNPVLHPFIDECGSPDVLLIQINPVRRDGTPTSARDIMNRVNEISFNGSLLKELRMVEFVNKCLRRGDLKGQPFREIFMHRIDGGSGLGELSPSSKVNAEWLFLTHLRDLGRASAEEWLDRHFDDIGKNSTISIEPYFHMDDEVANISEEVPLAKI